MEESYILALKLVSSRYDSSYEYFNILVLALSTLIYKYKDKIFLIEKIFNDIDIIIKKDSIKNMLKKNKIDIVSYDDDELEDGYDTTYAISSLGYTFILEDNEFVKYQDKPFIVCNSNCNNNDLLNSFIHEFNHLIKSSINSIEVNDLEYCVRCGIGFFHCKYIEKDDDLDYYKYYEVLDEVINVIETTEMMENLLLLPNIDSYDIDQDNLGVDSGYDVCVELIRPLWSNPTFRSLIEDNIIDGEVDNIINGFDKILGEGSFDKITDYLDNLDYIEGLNDKNKRTIWLKNNVRKMVNEYNTKTNYTYVFSK